MGTLQTNIDGKVPSKCHARLCELQGEGTGQQYATMALTRRRSPLWCFSSRFVRLNQNIDIASLIQSDLVVLCTCPYRTRLSVSLDVCLAPAHI